ncbi:pre-mRNA-processing protein 40A-like isoform X1 [Prunus dulcis]|uniref:pre-mRNA-processing protein 40A-like isoform X1 n=1 Tax=Prunus dulcis TaxID=3755 RepID=UPI001481D876|nr:pre-mRNA-processing protein 40A-like isoform X1 [Prunus dulcis]XP_034227001.1 pre-mRNA-processing protein 40A-like isoform X1 [Prunus dulcis]XP_034227002.1 pre-mRNA-processing protein 40A-like isoform X1 [Prunus dulcis]
MANNPQFSGLQPLRPPMVGSVDPPRSLPPMSFQFRPVVPAPHSQEFISVASQNFQHVGRGVPLMNVRLPPPTHQPQFSQPMQQLPPRSGQPGHGMLPSQAIPLPVSQPNRSFASELPLPQPNSQGPNNAMPNLGGPRTPLSSSYTFTPSSYGQMPRSFNDSTQYQSISQLHAPNVSSEGQVTPLQHTGERPAVTSSIAPETGVRPNPAGGTVAEWREHTSAEGRRFYYNRRTGLSTWEKPFELMTPLERADASTNWKEFTSPDGRKYYYNKVTKESRWIMPEELKLARELVEKAPVKEMQQEMLVNHHATVTVSPPVAEADTLVNAAQVASSPVSVAPVIATGDGDVQTAAASRSSTPPVVASPVIENPNGVHTPVVVPSSAVSSVEATVTINDTVAEPMESSNNLSAQDFVSSADGVLVQENEEATDDVTGKKINDIASEEKPVDREPISYENKLEAKDAFKALLESTNIGSDWTWDRAMRVIINDKRYGALKTLGERKQAFNEFLVQRKKQEAEERRIKQKKAREEFKKMLEECSELTSSTRWGKVESIFEHDERFKAVERDRDRRDMFENYVEELQKKERAKAMEERKHNIMEYRQFLESCDFIKASSQWRKVQDRLEADERCSCLEKIDRLEIFQEYLRDLEKEEEEQRRIQKEELRKTERKNRDDFRKLMEEHLAAGTLTAKSHWRDYCMKVKDLPTYLAVASNTSGSTPKDLFEDVVEELQKQYHEDKTRIKDAVKLGKVMLTSTWKLEDFKTVISNDIGFPPISDANLKLVFDELLERVKEKEEKEAKKRKRLADDFSHLLSSIKEITPSSKWEDYKSLLEGSQECSAIGEESFCKEIFDKHVMQLKEQAKEKERKRKEEKEKKEKERDDRERRRTKQRREKEVEYEREREERLKKDGLDSEIADVMDIHDSKEKKRSGKDDNKKHRKRHHSDEDHANGNENDRSKRSHGSSSDHKKSRRQAPGHESDTESRHRRHKRDHRNGSRRSGDHDELEDGEFGDVGESR